MHLFLKIFALRSIATSFYNAPKARYSMKRCLYVLLVLLCLFPLTSCRAEISDHDHTVTQNTVMETTTEFSALTDIESSSDTAGDSTILSPVRYTIDYEITDIFEKYPEIKTKQFTATRQSDSIRNPHVRRSVNISGIFTIPVLAPLLLKCSTTTISIHTIRSSSMLELLTKDILLI